MIISVASDDVASDPGCFNDFWQRFKGRYLGETGKLVNSIFDKYYYIWTLLSWDD